MIEIKDLTSNSLPAYVLKSYRGHSHTNSLKSSIKYRIEVKIISIKKAL